jgi:hypothetical protein
MLNTHKDVAGFEIMADKIARMDKWKMRDLFNALLILSVD